LELSINPKLRYLLLQVRDQIDPIRFQEIDCFVRALDCPPERLTTCDLLQHVPTPTELAKVDCLLIGGSGKYSATQDGGWLDRSFDFLRDLVEIGKPTFASCWGFQAMAKALGGRLVTDLDRAELGTLNITLTAAGRADEIFGAAASFPAHLGHEDIVDELPAGLTHLASSALVHHQAFKVPDKPIYATQFHPELRVDCFLDRVRAYPEYVTKIAGIPIDEFLHSCYETPHANSLLQRFASLV
jgi:GMP synthase (glutamine-hydrolysing)